MEITKQQIIHTDVLIIGGGTAGCYAALTIREKSDAKIVIAEKANIKRSGCLAAGVNAINAYIVKGRKPQDYVDYARKDADEIVRGDLLLTMSEHLNKVTSKMEQLGLVILKDENGEYVARGNRNIKINGENIKPILADAVNAPVSVMATAGEGGAWGIALLAAYMVDREEGETLDQFLDNKVFAGNEGSTLDPNPEGVEGFNIFMERYLKGIPIERAAVDSKIW